MAKSAKEEKKIIVREIAPKIKEIKSGEKESELEEEVKESPEGFNEVQVSAEDEFSSIILRSGEEIPRVTAAPIQPTTPPRTEPEFSQTRAYAPRQENIGTVEDRRARYITPQQAVMRIDPSINPVVPTFNEGAHHNFVANELRKLRGGSPTEERRYAEPLEPEEKKPRRRYPWEA